MRNADKIWNVEDMRQIMAEARVAYNADTLSRWLDAVFAEAAWLQWARQRKEEEEEE